MKKIILVIGLWIVVYFCYAQQGYSTLLNTERNELVIDSFININNLICERSSYTQLKEQRKHTKKEFRSFEKFILKMNVVYKNKIKSLRVLKRYYLKQEFKTIKREDEVSGTIERTVWIYKNGPFSLRIRTESDTILDYSLTFNNYEQMCYDKTIDSYVGMGIYDYRGLDILKGLVRLPSYPLLQITLPSLYFEWNSKY